MLNNTKDILTLKELQELLHIGKNTALRLVQSGEIEAFKVGKQWRIVRQVIYAQRHIRPFSASRQNPKPAYQMQIQGTFP